MRKTRSTTQEERVQIAKECLEAGKNYGAIALKHNVSYQQVRTWTLRFEEIGEAGLEDRRGKRKRNQVRGQNWKRRRSRSSSSSISSTLRKWSVTC